MRRADLSAGLVVWYSPTGDWINSTYAEDGSSARAVVVDPRPHISRGREYVPVDQGTGVLIEQAHTRPDGTAITFQRLVITAHLRGPFQECLDKVKAARIIRQEASARAQARMEIENAKTAAMIQACKARGLDTITKAAGQTRYQIPVPVLAAVLAALPDGWTYDPSAKEGTQ